MNNDEKALEGFCKIASGEHKVDAFTATDASMRMGFLFKKQRKFKEAINIFWQVAEKSPLKDDADYARLLVAGELWESGMGFYEKHLSLIEKMRYYKESLKVCNIILNDPTVRDEIRIIAELIQLEDYFFQGEYDTAKNLGEAFLQKWTPRLQDMTNKKVYGKTWNITNCPRRQIITAQMWMGMTYFKLELYDKCIEMCQKVNSDMWTSEDPYRNFNVFGEALLFEAMSWEKLGDYAKSENLKKICGERYTEWFNVTGKAILEKHQPIASFSDSLY
ncbi:hypothetical protein JW926_04310 [Candidatus Sumerlaeota bacterium]|nr:hypothetical protein [Candidatus Sumerlaeota bacterium]